MNNLPTSHGQGNPSYTPNYDNCVGGQWPKGLPSDIIPGYIDEIDTYTAIEEIMQDFPAPSGEPSATHDDVPSGSSSKRRRTAKAGTAKAGKQVQPRRFYTKEESRQRRTERQRNYRMRRQQAEVEVKEKISDTAREIEATYEEREAILVEHNVLLKAVDYCTYCFNTAQAVVSSAIGRVRSECKSAAEGLAWLGLQVYNPSDAQLHAYLDRKNMEELQAMSLDIMRRCADLFARWEAEPQARPNIEAQLSRMQNIRIRSTRHLARTRPGETIDLVRRHLIPVEPDGAPNPKLVEIVAKLELTPEQLESFEREWNLYLQRTEKLRQEARSAISFLSSSEDAASFCSLGAAGLYLDRLQAVHELETHPVSEAHAITNFNLWAPSNLTMHQKAVLLVDCLPYYPDFIQVCRILFGDTPQNGDQAGVVNLE